ncbi:MAG: baseplate J/gp47 family protein, partial [Myxococcota bacterium]|nr:baseplate J/gp47 family protein [Myxococcota bacterium]
SVTCSNPVTAVGLDPPTNARLQQMCLDWLAFRSVRGPRGAYGWAISGTDPKTGAPLATNIVTGAQVNINRWLVSSASHIGDVLVVITSPTGTVDSNDLAGVVQSIEKNVRPDGVSFAVSPATPVPYVAALVVYVRAPPAVTADALQAAITTALSAFFAEYPIGGETVSDDAHPGGFTGLTGTAITGAAAVGVATLAGATLMSVMGAPDLAMTALQVATDTDALSVTVRIIPS